MIISKMFKLFISSLILFLFYINQSFADSDFNQWVKNFKVRFDIGFSFLFGTLPFSCDTEDPWAFLELRC